MEKKSDNPTQECLGSLTTEQLKVLAGDIRADILSTCLHNGGHLSSNLGVVELTIALLKAFDYQTNDILFDVGHQSYTYKILTGRSISNIRKTGGVAPFNLREESPFDRYSNGHSGDCLGTAIGMAEAKNAKGDNSFTIAVIGDGSAENGLSLEAFDYLATRKDLKNLIVVINDNGMSIRPNQGVISRQFQKLRNSRLYFRTSNSLGQKMSKHRWSWKLFLVLRNMKDRFKRFVIQPSIFETAGLKYMGPFDGNDFESLDLAFEKARAVAPKMPVVVHLLTKKGYGYAPAEEDESGKYHGVSQNFDASKKPVEEKLDFVSYKAKSLDKLMSRDPKMYVLCPAMVTNSGLEGVYKKYPGRCLDVGIAEENAVVVASGLALKGMHPVIDIYSTFLQRTYDELMENISRQKIPSLFLIDRAGLVGEDGSSHQGLYDVGFVKTIPHARIRMPFIPNQCTSMMIDAFQYQGPTFVRIPKGKPIEKGKDFSFSPAFSTLVKKGNKTLVLGIGPYGYQALSLLNEKVDAAVLTDLLPDEEILDRLEIDRYASLYLYDPYATVDGTASYLAEKLLERGYKGKFKAFTFPRTFVTFGQIPDLLKMYRLAPEDLPQRIKEEEENNA